MTVATAELAALATRDAANVERLRERLGDPPTLIVPELAEDVHDLEGLALVRAHLFDLKRQALEERGVPRVRCRTAGNRSRRA